MHNLIILGCGRSGTSMVTGTLATAGYWTDNNEWNADRYNPKGYFESLDIHQINDRILSRVAETQSEFLDNDHFTRNLARDGLGWISLLKLGTKLEMPHELIPNVKRYLANEPYCIKDVRFSYTLEVWKPYLNDTRFVCVFRHPASTIQSLMKYASHRDSLWFSLN